jgi:transposase
MIRVALTPAQRNELRVRTSAGSPRTRDRLEMIRLADAGWSVPRIARHFQLHEQTVRRQVKAFLTGGFAALADRPRPGRPRRVTAAQLDALAALLDAGGRTWTTPQLATWLAREHGVQVHPDHLSRLLHRRGFRWKRTKTSVAHKRRDPAAYEAAVGDLHALKKRQPQA